MYVIEQFWEFYKRITWNVILVEVFYPSMTISTIKPIVPTYTEQQHDDKTFNYVIIWGFVGFTPPLSQITKTLRYEKLFIMFCVFILRTGKYRSFKSQEKPNAF